jgi:hypothetical protein
LKDPTLDGMNYAYHSLIQKLGGPMKIAMIFCLSLLSMNAFSEIRKYTTDIQERRPEDILTVSKKTFIDVETAVWDGALYEEGKFVHSWPTDYYRPTCRLTKSMENDVISDEVKNKLAKTPIEELHYKYSRDHVQTDFYLDGVLIVQCRGFDVMKGIRAMPFIKLESAAELKGTKEIVNVIAVSEGKPQYAVIEVNEQEKVIDCDNLLFPYASYFLDPGLNALNLETNEIIQVLKVGTKYSEIKEENGVQYAENSKLKSIYKWFKYPNGTAVYVEKNDYKGPAMIVGSVSGSIVVEYNGKAYEVDESEFKVATDVLYHTQGKKDLVINVNNKLTRVEGLGYHIFHDTGTHVFIKRNGKIELHPKDRVSVLKY